MVKSKAILRAKLTLVIRDPNWFVAAQLSNLTLRVIWLE